MNPLTLITHSYERKARLYRGAALAACGGVFLMAQLARDAGKKGELSLFASWDGMPSVAIFRHHDQRVDPITKARCHKKMASLVKGAKAPSPADEEADPVRADQVYTAWSTYVRVNTRDTKKYSLLFQENLNYGYRRNTWGLRPMGIITSALAGITGIAAGLQVYRITGMISLEIVGATIVAIVLLLLWVFRFSGHWVRIPADAYAARLVEAVDSLVLKKVTA